MQKLKRTIIVFPGLIAFQLYVETSGTSGQAGSMQSGVAIANAGSNSTTATLEPFNLDGTSTGLTSSVTIPGNGHVSTFVNSLFPTLSATFQGTLRVAAPPGSSLSVVGLRARYNELGDFLITTTPAANRGDPPLTGELVFPHVANDGGYNAVHLVQYVEPVRECNSPFLHSVRIGATNGCKVNVGRLCGS